MFADLQQPERLHSLGRLAALLQASPGEIEKAAREAGVAVIITIDDRQFYADEDLSKLRAAIRRGEAMH